MKKTIPLLLVVLLSAFLSVMIIESSTNFSLNVHDHLWLTFIGRWHCSERSYLEMAFNPDETFTEYSFGKPVYSGTVQIVDGDVVLVYDGESCLRKQTGRCSLTMEYDAVHDRVILQYDGARLTLFREQDAYE